METGHASHFGTTPAPRRAIRLSGLPTTYAEYRDQRRQQLLEDYARGPLTDKLLRSHPLCPKLCPLAFAAALPLLTLSRNRSCPDFARGAIRLAISFPGGVDLVNLEFLHVGS